MRLSFTSRLLVIGLLWAAAPLARAENEAPAPGTAPAQTPHKKKLPASELEDRMDEMGGAYKKLRRQISDTAQNPASLVLVAKIRAATDKSLTLTPAKAADLPEADRPKFVADYQEGIKQLQSSLAKLETALKANDNVEASKILKEIGAEQREGHKQFKRPEKD